MLPHLVYRTLRAIAWVALIGSLAGLSAAMVRLLPWLVSPDVPATVSLTFFRSLAVASGEVALFVALPLVCSLEVIRWNSDGTAATLRTLGLGPLRQALHAVVAGMGVSLVALAASTASGAVAADPGRLSNGLVQAAAVSACRTREAARVPLVDVTWLCSDGIARLAGRFPRHGPATMAWTATGARFSQDLTAVELDDVHWSFAKPAVHIQAKHVVVSGFVPWLAPSFLPPWLRGTATSFASWLTSAACAWALLRWPSASKARGVVVAVAGCLGFLLFGARLLEVASWAGLPVLAALGSACSIVAARVTLYARLPGTRAGGTKRDVAVPSVAESADG